MSLTEPTPEDGPDYQGVWEEHIEKNAEKRARANRRLAYWRPLLKARRSPAYLEDQIQRIEAYANGG